ncbi:aminotransferase class V-fold PLP-dependent enzyme [Virgibacillus halodenitrificans]|uniref:aminotransferase class V-fold PLP-dependent enzyme n=1 Tax=Virgibacillus halodenitrificans TaxID=1482 RepID=UPI0024C01D93|nr:aminotransferase class V-fold PLP-dependent enzyme [Virgibacillus halodenitrificans]WHX26216.1 aminotransferase class V-fold PLP-dependent enzyme [Virgibacillus halodenitrificans]
MIQSMNSVREAFPILRDKVQLSSCSQSALHVDVKNAIHRYVNTWEESGMDWGGWMQACENARAQFAKMINADLDEIAIVSSVSHGLSSVAASLQNEKRKKVFVTDFDFPTVGHIWLSHQENYKVEFIKNKLAETITAEDYRAQVDEETLLVSTSHVSFYDGFKQNLKEIATAIHEKGAYLLVDAYQSLGQTPIDVKEMEVDMLTAGLQKYALGTPGIAFLYINKKISERLTPKITGWFGQHDPFAFDIKNISYAEATKRFDSGTFPMINGFAAESALTILNNYGIEKIEQQLEQLSAFTINAAEEKGLIVKSPKDIKKKGSNTAIYVKNASEIESKLAQQGIILSARNDVIRIAPHFYNTKDDIHIAIDKLTEILY